MNDNALLQVLKETAEAVGALRRDVDALKFAVAETPLLQKRFQEATKFATAAENQASIDLLLLRVNALLK